MVRVGIPRALAYYQYFPMWQSFFSELGAEVVVSPPTNPKMLLEGSARVISDTCLPVKVFCGHVISLAGKCDFIFIPAIRSVKHKVFNCAKFLGLPDMIRAVIPECPPILEIEVDVNQGRRRLYQAIYRLGRHFTWNPFTVRRAALSAMETHQKYCRTMVEGRLKAPEAIEALSKDVPLKKQENQTKGTIAIIGHPYILYDDYINHSLFKKLGNYNYGVMTPEMVAPEQLEMAITRIVGKAHWIYEEEVVGAGGYYLESAADGIIGLMAFGCGPDSLMMEIVRRQASKNSVPFMTLTLEEHSSEAGVVTRLEAFLDMIDRKKKQAVCA